MKAIITCSLDGKSFKSEFPIAETVPEYVIADEAYRLGLLFAQTRILAKYGRKISGNELNRYLQKLEYNYTII